MESPNQGPPRTRMAVTMLIPVTIHHAEGEITPNRWSFQKEKGEESDTKEH